MRRGRGTDRSDEQLAWQAVRRHLGAGHPDAERACGPALTAALAYLTEAERDRLRRKGRVPSWFVQEVRHRAAAAGGTPSTDMPAGMISGAYDAMTDAVAAAGAQWADHQDDFSG